MNWQELLARLSADPRLLQQLRAGNTVEGKRLRAQVLSAYQNAYTRRNGAQMNADLQRVTGMSPSRFQSTVAGDADRRSTRLLLHGLTLGFSDELAGLGAAIIPGGQDYTQARDASRRSLADARALAAPGEDLVTEGIGGLMTPAPFVGRLGQAARTAAGGGLLGAAAEGATVGGTLGATYGAGDANGGAADRLRGAAVGGALGAATGAVVHPVVENAPRVARAVARSARRTVGNQVGAVGDVSRLQSDRMWRDVREWYGRTGLPVEGPPGTTTYDLDKGRVVVHRNAQGQPVGFVTADTESGSVWHAVVDPAHRRQGIATQMYDALRSSGVQPATGAQTADGAAFRQAYDARQTGDPMELSRPSDTPIGASSTRSVQSSADLQAPPTVSFRRVSPEDFTGAISSARGVEKNGRLVGETVYQYPSYDGMQTFLSEDGKTGFALKHDPSDGSVDLVSVFNVGQRGAGEAAVQHGVRLGATKLDAFDESGFLPNKYARFGFREVGRDPWNPQFAPEGWRGGTPDVVYMEIPQAQRQPFTPDAPATADTQTVQQRADAQVKVDGRTRASRAARETGLLSGLEPHEAAQYEAARPSARQQMLEVFSRMPSEESLANAMMAGAPQYGWYDAAGKAITQALGSEDAPRFTALLAATSPRQSVQGNLSMSLQLWDRWVLAGRPTDPDAIRRLLPRGIMQGHIPNTLRALTASATELTDPKTVTTGGLLSGPKVDPFFANLMGETRRIVNDTHMAQLYGTTQARIGTSTVALPANARLRNAAQLATRLSGTPFEPVNAQETAWSWKHDLSRRGGLLNPGGAAADRTAEDAFRTHGLPPEGITAPGFGALMSEQPYATQLLQIPGTRLPDPAPAPGIPGLDRSLIDPGSLVDLTRRIDAARFGRPIFGLAPLVLGGGAGLLGASQGRSNQPGGLLH